MLCKKVSTTFLWIISLITGRFSKSRGKKKNAEKGAYRKEVVISYVAGLG